MRPLTLLFLVTVALTPACYRWVPAEPGVVPPGTEVRVRTTVEAMDDLARIHGEGIAEFRGPVVTWNDEEVSLLTEVLLQRPGFPATTLADTVRLRQDQVENISVPELSVSRTVAMVAGVIGGAAGVLLLTRSFGGDIETNTGDPPIDEAVVFRIPVFSLSW